MVFLRTCFNTAVIGPSAVLWLILSGIVAAPFVWLFKSTPARRVRKFVYRQARGIVFFMRMSARSLRVETEQRPQSPCIIVANHASALDLYTVSAFGFDNVVYITKGWVFKIPFFRFIMRKAGYMDAEKTPPEEMLARCKRAVQDGCDIVVFPQGSRKNPQARFKSGAFYLAEQLNLPVVPVALAGTGKMLAAGSVVIRPARVVLKMFPAVYPSQFEGPLVHLQMAQQLKKQIMDFVNSEEEK